MDNRYERRVTSSSSRRPSNGQQRPQSTGFLYGGDARGIYGAQDYGKRSTMIYGKPPRRRWPFILALIVVAIIVILLVMFACKPQSEEPEEQTEEQTSTEQTEEVVQQDVTNTITITAVGDCTLGTDESFSVDTNFNTVFANNGSDPSYNFKRVTPYTATDDLTIANFEGTLTESTDRQDKQFAFKGPASYADILVQGSVEAVNLANNHSYDYGNSSYEDTKQALSDYGITSFGYDRTNTFTVKDTKIGLYGVNCVGSYETATEQMYADIAALQQEGCSIIIGCMHAGTEGNGVPDDAQVTLAHSAIDAGTNLVIGTHPHVLQGIERYNNAYILYSLGNFVFGGNSSPSEFATAIWQQTFTVTNGQLVVDENTLNSVCLIPCRLSSSSSTLNDYQPLPLTGDEATEVLNTINNRSAQLSGDGIVLTTTVDENDRAYLNQ